MDTTITTIRVGVLDLDTAVEFLCEAFPNAEALSLGDSDAAVMLESTSILLHAVPDSRPAFGAWITFAVPDLTCVSAAGQKFAAQKLQDRVCSDGTRSVTYVVTPGLVIGFNGPRRKRPSTKKQRPQPAAKRTRRRQLQKVGSV